MAIIVHFVLISATLAFVNCQRSNEAIDTGFLEAVLDAEECDRQITLIRENVLLGMQFADAGIRLPRGVLQGASVDLGNYHQCLSIQHSTDEMDIQGKYCAIRVPVDQDLEIPRFENPRNRWKFNPSSSYLDKETTKKIEQYNIMRAEILAMNGDMDALEEYNARTAAVNPLSGTVFTLGVCVPKPCTTHQAINSYLFNVTAVGFNFSENYCRLLGDKPRAGADIAAIVVFSLIGLVTLLSTCYDLIHRFLLNTDIKKINPVYQSFSVYTNGQRLVTFNSGHGNLQCIDGIRSLAMVWVIIGHSFATEPFIANSIDSFMWMISASGLWITTATMTVDTFFTVAGILLVYTTAGKMNGKTLLKNLHWFYLTRLVRVMPLLAVTVLLQASFFNHMADGPSWQVVVNHTNRCRKNWLYTLLNIQNWVDSTTMCTGHGWYVAIDFQLYIVSPLVLFWVLTGNRRAAWLGLMTGLMAVLIASTIYNFNLNLQAGVIVPSRGADRLDYMPKYYFNTLTRAAPFFVGLISGYVLHLFRGKKVQMQWFVAVLLWLCAFGIMGAIFYFKYRILQLNWDNQFMDNFMNSFMRPAWACVISWIIFACVHGFAGPINWFLTLDIWRLPARLSYGMYLLHYPFMFSINGTMVAPIFFSVGAFTFKFLSHFVLALAVSYVVTVLVDSPASALYKQLMIKVQPKKTAKEETKEVTKESSDKDKELSVAAVHITAENTAETQQTNVPTVMIK